jgi:hypothetical protein
VPAAFTAAECDCPERKRSRTWLTCGVATSCVAPWERAQAGLITP